MSGQLELHVDLLREQLSLLGCDPTKDIATMISRASKEGEKFLTIRLPAMEIVLNHLLQEGLLPSLRDSGFSPKSRNDKRPQFLWQLWSRLCDAQGVILPAFNIDAVRALRQILLLHSKLKELPTPDKVEDALAGFVKTDREISSHSTSPEDFNRLSWAAMKLWGKYFDSIENTLYRDGFLRYAKHGPGAVAQVLTSNGKWACTQWSERLNRVFPAIDYLATYLGDEGDWIELLSPEREIPSRIICVAKTAKTPRIISAEPTYNQFIQQGLSALFVDWMKDIPSVNIQDQRPNQLLAREGSLTGEYATIDLSEASDRMSLQLVKAFLRKWPTLLSAVLACRSQRAQLPNGDIILLRKFAPMGSALTFPLETLVFATIASLGRAGQVLTRRRVSVYGDDIVVTHERANDVIANLESFGFKVNNHKTFLRGKFRESCGGEFVSGIPVKPVKLRKRLPNSRRDVEELIALVAFRNLYWEQYGDTEFVMSLDDLIEGIIPFPAGYPETAGLVKWSFSVQAEEIHPELQNPAVRCVVPKYQLREDPLDNHPALLKFFWTPFQEDQNHLNRAGRPVSARLKYGVVSLI